MRKPNCMSELMDHKRLQCVEGVLRRVRVCSVVVRVHDGNEPVNDIVAVPNRQAIETVVPVVYRSNLNPLTLKLQDPCRSWWVSMSSR